MTYNYYIGTTGKRMMMLRLLPGYIPSENITLTFDIVQCNPIQYYIFKFTKINLKAEDKTQWLRRWITKKWLILTNSK